jgi:uncharacterized protein YegJ (DUF2314 family)
MARLFSRQGLVLCDPRPRGIFSFLRRGRVRASRAMSTLDNENMMAVFADMATDLMAERARNTVGVLRAVSAEFAEFEAKPMVKLGYVVDGGKDKEREHLWFEVHSFGDDNTVEGTLVNEPYFIARIKAGERGRHSLDLLSDWTVLTPAGSITPRETAAARRLRGEPEVFRRIVADFRRQREARGT